MTVHTPRSFVDVAADHSGIDYYTLDELVVALQRTPEMTRPDYEREFRRVSNACWAAGQKCMLVAAHANKTKEAT